MMWFLTVLTIGYIATLATVVLLRGRVRRLEETFDRTLGIVAANGRAKVAAIQEYLGDQGSEGIDVYNVQMQEVREGDRSRAGRDHTSYSHSCCGAPTIESLSDTDDLVRESRRLANQRQALIAAGVDPAELEEPTAAGVDPDDLEIQNPSGRRRWSL